MAFIKINLNDQNWTLIGENVTQITFFNTSQFPIYINFNSSNAAPTDEVGLVYPVWAGEKKASVTQLTNLSSPNYVFAKTLSRNGTVIVEVE